MARGRASNLIAILAAVTLIAAGLWYLRSRPSDDECARWQSVVQRQAELLASQHGGQAAIYVIDAAETYKEDQPAGCELPSGSERRL